MSIKVPFKNPSTLELGKKTVQVAESTDKRK